MGYLGLPSLTQTITALLGIVACYYVCKLKREGITSWAMKARRCLLKKDNRITEPERADESAREPEEEEQEETRYKRRTGTSGIGGQLYEIELLMLSLLNAVVNMEEKKLDKFRLATNMEEAGDFDDLVFKYRHNENGVGNWKTVFLQAKHKESEKGKDKRITLDSLISQSEKGDFSLRKYLSSYRKIKQHGVEKNHPIFKDGLENCEFIIFTNAGFNTDKCRIIVEEESIHPDHVLHLGVRSHNYFKLKADTKVVDALKNSLDFEILARDLAQAASSGCIDRNKNIFRDYEVSIGERVIEAINEREGKMREDFLNGVQDGELSRAFFEEIMKKKEFANKSLDKLKDELRAKNIQLPNNFGIAKDNYLKLSLPCKHVSDDDIEKFLIDLKLFVAQPNEQELSQIIKEKIGSTYKTKQNEIDEVFAQVEYKVRKWWKDGNEYITEENRFFQDAARFSIHFDVRAPVALFTGRSEEIEYLHKAIERNQGKDSFTVISQITSISGLGGIGKSELARKYAHDYANSFDGNIIWINAESEATVHDSFYRLAKDKLQIETEDANNKEKDIKSIVEEIYKFFNKRKCLFIFDNAEMNKQVNMFLPLHSITPGSKKPCILITSRNREWGRGIEVVDLNELKLEDAIELVKKGLNINDVTQYHRIKDLVEKLQCLPLAIQQAVAYIEDQRVTGEFSIDDYLEKFETKTRDLLDSEVFQGIDNDYEKTTYTTWKITVDRIARDKQNGELALKILNIIAYLAPENINREMFLSLAGNEEDVLKSSVRCLVKYSMLNGEKKQSVLSVHRLVQEVTRLEMEEQGKYEEVIYEAFQCLKVQFPYGNETARDYSRKKDLLPHLEAFLSHIDMWIKKEPTRKQEIETRCLISLLNLMADGYSDFYPKRLRELLERAIQLEEKYHGTETVRVAELLENLGMANGFLGDYNKKKEYIERALFVLKSHYGVDHFELATPLVNLANAYNALGMSMKAIEYLERAIAIKEKHLGPGNVSVALALSNLGNAYGDTGNPKKQKELIEKALPILEEHYGTDHVQIARALENLALAYADLGNPKKQKELIERALPIFEEHYGTDHFQTARTLQILGIAYGKLGDHKKHQELLERASFLLEKHYGPQNVDVASALVNLGNAYGNLGNSKKQMELVERALPILEEHFGAEDVEVAKALTILGNAYGILGNPNKQMEVLERALPILEEYYGAEHSDIDYALVNLCGAYIASGNSAKAMELQERVKAAFVRLFRAEH